MEVLAVWQLAVEAKELLLVHAQPHLQAAAIHSIPALMPVNKRLSGNKESLVILNW